MKKKDIIAILGMEIGDYSYSQRQWTKGIFKEFNELAKVHNPNQIWFKGDYGIYTDGEIVAQTENLMVVKEM